MIVMASTSAYTVGIVIVVVIALLIVVSCIKIVPQASAVIPVSYTHLTLPTN